MILPVLIALVAGWMQRHQQQGISCWLEENRVLNAHLGGPRLHLTDTARRRLAAHAHSLGRKRLKAVATLATPSNSPQKHTLSIDDLIAIAWYSTATCLL